uniref:Uncharacterized protein n=1 Tax=Romanomermis culicivorax TaxID=13658 RepID=A0A915L4N7_ROMCU
MKVVFSIIFLIYCCSTLVKSDEEVPVTVGENCDYYGNDFRDENGEVIKLMDVDDDQCKIECIKKEQQGESQQNSQSIKYR